MRKTFLFLAASCSFVMLNTFPAQAQSVLLTSDAVKNHLQSEADFLQKSAQQASEELDLKSNGGQKELSISNLRAVAEVKRYLNKHLKSNFKYKDTIQTDLGMMGSSEEKVNYNRTQYIDNILNTFLSLKDVQNDLQILNTKVAMNGKSAKVKFRNKAVMKAQAEEIGGQSSGGFTVNSDSLCDAKVVISTQDVIQTEKLDCETTTTMTLPTGYSGQFKQ